MLPPWRGGVARAFVTCVLGVCALGVPDAPLASLCKVAAIPSLCVQFMLGAFAGDLGGNIGQSDREPGSQL